MSFSAIAYGKWILAGEHSVLRGSPALVFPLTSKVLKLSYQETDQSLSLLLKGNHGQELEVLLWTVLDRACAVLHKNRSELKGELTLESEIPVGAGMGASATLCVALTKWFGYLGYLKDEDYYEFARQLENLFHGESSGVDIAVALSGQGLQFFRNGPRIPVEAQYKPLLYISYCGQRGVTLDCVNRVKSLLEKDPQRYQELDRQMQGIVEKSTQILTTPEKPESFQELSQQLTQANQIFQQWGLTEGSLQEHMNWLLSQGAVAVKPTGSGGGGFALSLWKKSPPREILHQLIPCF